MTVAAAAFAGTIVWTVAAGLGAAVLHELTHWSVARLLGRPAWIDWKELNCYHHLPIAGPEAPDYAIRVAPFAVGALLAIAWLLGGLRITIPLVIAWGVYTLGGVPNDFRIDPGPPPTR